MPPSFACSHFFHRAWLPHISAMCRKALFAVNSHWLLLQTGVSKAAAARVEGSTKKGERGDKRDRERSSDVGRGHCRQWFQCSKNMGAEGGSRGRGMLMTEVLSIAVPQMWVLSNRERWKWMQEEKKKRDTVILIQCHPWGESRLLRYI